MAQATVATPVYAAVVRAADGVWFATSGMTVHERAHGLVEFIRGRCAYTLWPPAATRVRTLIEQGNVDEAIATYFANVGDRWDVEALELTGP